MILNNRDRENTIKVLLSKNHQKAMEKDIIEIVYSNVPEADELIKDINHQPEAFFIGCLMDRQIDASKAWTIPYIIKEAYGTLSMKALSKISLEEWKVFYNERKLHRYTNIMAELLYKAIKKVNEDYQGDVRNIWQNTENAKVIVERFKAFDGIGPKIATMAVNILYRDFKLPIKDLSGIDISPDVQVMKVFYRLGLIEHPKDKQATIQKARSLNPSFPGVFDLTAWDVGRGYCHNTNPACHLCSLNDVCQKRTLPQT